MPKTRHRRSWNDTPVETLAHKPAVFPESAQLSEAVAGLQDPQAHCLLVTGGDGRLSGVFTEGTVLRKVVGRGVKPDARLSDFMDTDVFTVRTGDTFAHAMDLMAREKISYLPVCDAAGRPTGVFSIRWLMDFLADHFIHRAGEGAGRGKTAQEEIWDDVVRLPMSFVLTSRGALNGVGLSPGQSLAEVEALFRENNHQAALVFEEGRIKGLLQLRDIPFKVLHRDPKAERMPVRDFMTRAPETILEDEHILDAIRKFASSQILVLSFRSGAKDGLVTAKGVLAYIHDHIHEDE